MNELIPVNYENDEQLVSARDLYEFLGIKKRFNAWWQQYQDMFMENEDFSYVPKSTQQNQYGGVKEIDDYALKIDVSKHIAMLTKTEKGTEAREYFIKLERLWNSPEMVTKRALEFQLKKINLLEQENAELQPKALFSDAVRGSINSCLVKDLSVLLKQNNVDIGQNRLFKYLRANGFIGKGNGHYNKPTQKALNQGLLEYREHFRTNSAGQVVTHFTPLVTGKGQQYFINKFLEQQDTA